MLRTSLTSASVRNRGGMPRSLACARPITRLSTIGRSAPFAPPVRAGCRTDALPPAPAAPRRRAMDSAVLDLPAPVAARLRRPGWRDPRLLVGVVMVAASVALGSWAVQSAQTTVPVYVARDALVPGQRLEPDD